MDMKEIERRIEEIRLVAGDDEVAHGKEDDLHEAFIQYVAETAAEPLASMAKRVLSTKDIHFARWCA